MAIVSLLSFFWHFGGVEPAVSCQLTAIPVCRVGSMPRLTVTLRNNTKHDIYLVGSLDASSTKGRYPHCFFEITTPLQTQIGYKFVGCGQIGGIWDKSFVHVPSSGEYNPYTLPNFPEEPRSGYASSHQLLPWHYIVPGVYRFRFIYSTAQHDISWWLGTNHADVSTFYHLFRQVPKCHVVSNEVKVLVMFPFFYW